MQYHLSSIPLPATNFEMMDRESHVDFESDARLKAWAEKLDRMKGELSVQKIVDELYDWTARRMMDAKENDSKADEMLLKRCAYHGLNFSAPFIVMRHWVPTVVRSRLVHSLVPTVWPSTTSSSVSRSSWATVPFMVTRS